ncbi:hypothetical protein DACRYDRAFT_46690 [Dacryopinax primogenitus]|uniref:Uncharacterized protein n=1 Tax=Dacryopinax primogenitus (strain DJM 731) TaxID=1858805 RepID=M5GGH1_DACPD|nr:uncharacterized protein DACRYDRAFT_46690 [Dacryopinax primogenitus]EJU05478.1 hypothetical protein DACRYDRAFT_46690 [Dacryopinax primogenitus]
MKAIVLFHCLNGNKFVLSSAGCTPITDFNNHLLLGGLFLHLDPFGIGGFDHLCHHRPVSMAKQLWHLLMLHNGPFEKDAQFAFVIHNILQKRASYHDC